MESGQPYRYEPQPTACCRAIVGNGVGNENEPVGNERWGVGNEITTKRLRRQGTG